MKKSLTDILVCPQSGQGLVESAEDLVSADGAYRYPCLNSVPIVVENPQVFIGEWQIQSHHLHSLLRAEIQELEDEIRDGNLTIPAEKRLKTLRKSKQKYIKSLLELLKPLLEMETGGSPATREGAHHQAFFQLGRQHLIRYESNLFRDWVWGNVENQAYLNLLEESLDKSNPGTTLFIGAGAGRLPYDFHRKWSPPATIALEINPLFVLAAVHLIQGGRWEFPEFPLAPLPGGESGIIHELKAPEKLAAPEFQYIFADGVRPPFAEKSIQTLVTPWFVDIVESDFYKLAHRYNRILKKGGRWINFGSCFFQKASMAQQYSWSEVLEIMNEAGFRIHSEFQRSIPYLNSPYSAHQRQETLFIFSAEKVADSRVDVSDDPQHAWLTDSSLPVPALNTWSDQAAISRFQFEVLSSINGERSIDEVAQAMSHRYGFTLTQCKAALIQLLIEHLSTSLS